jgi:hypothetical protein
MRAYRFSVFHLAARRSVGGKRYRADRSREHLVCGHVDYDIDFGTAIFDRKNLNDVAVGAEFLLDRSVYRLPDRVATAIALISP